MEKALAAASLVGLVAVGFAALWTMGVDHLTDRAFAAVAAPESVKVSGQVPAGKKVTFLESGSAGCKPCEQMVPVMEALRQRHGDRVEVQSHDVKKSPSVAMQWRVVLIPTQVFLDAQGREVFRHEGFFALDDVLAVLRKMGVN